MQLEHYSGVELHRNIRLPFVPMVGMQIALGGYFISLGDCVWICHDKVFESIVKLRDRPDADWLVRDGWAIDEP